MTTLTAMRMARKQRQSNFATKLIELREAAGLSQTELGKRAGITKQAVSHLERGIREPTWGTVQVLAQALGVECQVFVDPGLIMPDEPSTD